MLPRVVLHKRNGHRHPPGTKDLSLGEMIRMVHSVRQEAPKPTFELLKFANIVRSEKAGALLDQVSRQIDGLQLALTSVLAQTRTVFDRGELADVRAALEAFRAQADLAGRLMTKLVAAADTRTSERLLLDLNDVLTETLDLVGPRLGAGVRITSHLDPELPRIAGNPRQLQQVFVTLITHAWRTAARPGTIAVETSHGQGVLRGEHVVRVRIANDGPGFREEILSQLALATSVPAPAPDGPDLDLYLAGQIVTEHGGALAADNPLEGGGRFTIELLAV